MDVCHPEHLKIQLNLKKKKEEQKYYEDVVKKLHELQDNLLKEREEKSTD